MKKILVPTDFSEQANNALDFAAQIVKRNDAEIILLNVVEHPGGTSYASSIDVTADYTNEPKGEEHVFMLMLMKKVKNDLNEIMERDEYADLNINPQIRVGTPFSTVTDILDEEDVDLIVMGTQGASGLEEIVVGSNTEKVVRHAKCPVISIKHAAKIEDIDDIAFATSLGDDKEEMIFNLKQLQELFEAKLHIVRINTPNNFKRDKHTMQRMEEFAKKHEFKNYTLNIYNDAEEEDGIIAFAEDKDMDMIAMGTHGRTGIMHLLSGSIAEDVVNHSKRPVWTYKI